MIWYLLIGGVVIGWTLLLLLSSERQRRLYEIEVKRQNALIAAQKHLEEQSHIPVLK